LRAFDNKVLWKMFRREREEVTGRRGKLRNEELHNFHCSPNVIRVVKSRRMKCTENVACTGMNIASKFSRNI